MSLFDHARNINVYGGNYVSSSAQANSKAKPDWEQLQVCLKELEKHSTSRAFYNSKDHYDQPKCLPHTRVAVFQEVRNWLHDASAEKPILWMYGPAGAGKSAIARSVAEKAEVLDYLLVASFFNRSDAERNNSERLIPTIAYQMISSLPSTREFVLKSIHDHPQVFSFNLRSQLERLIVRPLLDAEVAKSETRPMLILIDGVDECRRSEERSEFLLALKEIFSERLIPAFPPVVFLCASRSESDIRATFNDSNMHALSARIVLGDRFDPSSDIQAFLIHHFAEIRRCHPLKNHIPHNWPSSDALGELIRKSSGQFVYASTVAKHLASRKHNPIKRLRDILATGSRVDTSPFKELDALYRFVLSSITEDHHLITVRALGVICCSDVQPTPYQIEDLFSLDLGEALILFEDLHSLLDVRTSEDPIRPFHASFTDFLSDRSRSGKYHVEERLLQADCILVDFKYPKCQWYNSASGATQVRIGITKQVVSGMVLTDELFQFFLAFPWEIQLDTRNILHVCCGTCKTCEMLGLGDLGFTMVNEAFHLCEWAAKTYSDWIPIYHRAEVELEAWIITQISGPPSFSIIDPQVPESQREWWFSTPWELRCPNKIWLWRLYALCVVGRMTRPCSFYGTFCNLVCKTLENPVNAGLFHIDHLQRNLIIYNNLLTGLRHRIPKWPHENFAGFGTLGDSALLIHAARTPYLDELVPFLEDMASSGTKGLYLDHALISHWAELREAIARYKEKPILEDYDRDFKLYDGDIVIPPYLFVKDTVNPSYSTGLNDLLRREMQVYL